MLTVTLTRPNEKQPFISTSALSRESAVAAAIEAYSEFHGRAYYGALTEQIGTAHWRVQPGHTLSDGSTSLDRPILVAAFEPE